MSGQSVDEKVSDTIEKLKEIVLVLKQYSTVAKFNARELSEMELENLKLTICDVLDEIEKRTGKEYNNKNTLMDNIKNKKFDLVTLELMKFIRESKYNSAGRR
ncbi:MAG: hypothetical protein OWQ52_02935 [Metallosphaera prunae]|uniref:hypothetical protein n=1 Tax=Metallosphaera prunae TaxID=47304 RepID=UPI0022751C8E|nr:hypothetical protein [Metallosphaera prunae]MCY0861362.1 hypothetical protein [Metallosphaera prunae]